MSKVSGFKFFAMARDGALAGAAGGIAEIAWIFLYAALTGAAATDVARGVSAAVGLPIAAPAVGVATHMVLAVALGILLAFGWRVLCAWLTDRPGIVGQHTILLGTLAVVWAVNFLIILPWLSPDFVHLLPYQASLVSKLFFGLAVSLTFQFVGYGQADIGQAEQAGNGRADISPVVIPVQ